MCGVEFGPRKGEAAWQFDERRHCSRKCIIHARRPIEELASPYRQVKVDGRKTFEHRLIVEESIGRELATSEHVHHKDEDPTNNTLDNLQVVTPQEHRALHAKHPLTKTCVICGRTFTPHKTKRKRQQQCGNPSCKARLMSRNCKNRKLSDEQVEAIKARRAAGEKLETLAEAFGVSQTTISAIAHGKTRLH